MDETGFGPNNVVCIMKEEGRVTVEAVNAGKVPRMECVVVECFMKGGVTPIEWLVGLFNECFVFGVGPNYFKGLYIIPLHIREEAVIMNVVIRELLVICPW